jgi:hypothetical protein
MHRLPIAQQVLLAIQGVGFLALCVRLWWVGLHRVYVYFFTYLMLELLQILVPIFVPVQSLAYRNAFVVTEVLIVCSYALVVMELYSTILRDLAGIASVSRRYIKITLGLAILVSVLPLSLEKRADTVTAYLFVFERAVVSSLVVFVLLITGFLVYYPVPLNRNVIVYLLGYAVLFLTQATTLFINNLGYYLNQVFGTLLMGVYAACLLLWLFALDRRGENKTVVMGHQWNRADEARLLSQLEAINRSLLRVARK